MCHSPRGVAVQARTICACFHAVLPPFSSPRSFMYPQLYVRGELLGGCDIVLEMQASVCRQAGGWGVCLLQRTASTGDVCSTRGPAVQRRLPHCSSQRPGDEHARPSIA